VPHDVRDQVVDFFRRWNRDQRRAISAVAEHWRQQVLRLVPGYGRVNEHNGWIPRDFWLEQWEKEAIIGFLLKNLCSQVDWRMPLRRSRVGLAARGASLDT
jgi:hypothetical protein